MRIDTDTCYRALVARDRRFDGMFFVGVSTTGIYCRPVCTARTPGRDRCTFFATPAAAEKAGYRACFRCRPELAPGRAPLDAVSRLAERAAAAIEEGALNERSVEELAAALGVTGRHLTRSLKRELGVTPIELAQSCRLALAKRLLHDSRWSLADIAFASGFSSVRRFNAAFKERFGRPPSAVRRALPSGQEAAHALTLRLDARPPYDWDRLLGFLGPRAIPGVERVAGREYARVVAIGGHVGHVRVCPATGDGGVLAHVSLSLSGVLPQLVGRLRRLFDLDASPDAIARHLAADPRLAESLHRRPGLRLPGSFDPFETAVRAVLGQQVSVAAATTLAGRLVEAYGTPAALTTADENGEAAVAGLTHQFVTAAELAGVEAQELARVVGLPRRRAETLVSLGEAVASGQIALSGPRLEANAFSAQMTALPGIGDWTVQYLAMRALHLPDAFPAGDLVIRKALGGAGEREVRERAEAWRPWRSYAAMHLWTAYLEEGGER